MNLLTRSEAARKLGIGMRTLDRRLANGEIECYRLGEGPKAPVRISEEQLTAYLLSCSSEAQQRDMAKARQIIGQNVSP